MAATANQPALMLLQIRNNKVHVQLSVSEEYLSSAKSQTANIWDSFNKRMSILCFYNIFSEFIFQQESIQQILIIVQLKYCVKLYKLEGWPGHCWDPTRKYVLLLNMKHLQQKVKERNQHR